MITKKEYRLLYEINIGKTNLERLKEFFSEEEIIKMLKNLEKQGLIKIELRDNEIYSFMETSTGLAVLKSKEYKKWYDECGD